ncbi:DNA-directed RNA polymerases II 24 kDa polypeptide (RNA polymerase II subunit 5) [Mycoemilia scoparia]|uniref:DNA-directed RNA polymerases I, II, and III subunit RPABC1 n=1 Tax=Mycoemilia scoparia TaxID=417184 RepID=A0A9W7ZQV1_9FUNG|nr:DNA-directed RNA polymerases II 24 kDa polypeptide (RNA polymerase II subunit 5) [Mycoemilia scoparia]
MTDRLEVARMWRVYRTLHEMANDRGYAVLEHDINRSLEAFAAEFAPGGSIDRSRLTFSVQKRDDPSDQLLVFFPDSTTVGVQPIKNYLQKMIEQGVTKAIIVCRKDLTAIARKSLASIDSKYNLESFNEKELLVNITKHELVPKHVVLTAPEKKELLIKYRLKDSQIPRIKENDPVAKYYGMKRGQVVKIIRQSETAGRYLTYRICV